jgi:hypothetical protein
MIARKNSVIATVVAAVFIASGPSFAGQGRGSGGPKTHAPKATGGTHTTVAKGPSPGTVQHGAPKGPKSTSTMAAGAAKGPKTTSTSPKSGTASTKATGKSTTTASAKTTASSNKTTASAKKTEPAKTTASAKKTEPAKTTASAKKTEIAKTTTTSGIGTTSTTPTLTPVQQKLQQNTKLASKLETRLPKGTDLMTAAEGFRNLGQFVAAVNVSNNLGIDFVNLKTSMVDDGLSLGQSIQTWKPTANSTREASIAESQATVIINTSTTTTTTSTAKTKKPRSSSGGELHD